MYSYTSQVGHGSGKFWKQHWRYWLTSFVALCQKAWWSKWTMKRPQAALIMIDLASRLSDPQGGLSLSMLPRSAKNPYLIKVDMYFHFEEEFWYEGEKEYSCLAVDLKSKKQGHGHWRLPLRVPLTSPTSSSFLLFFLSFLLKDAAIRSTICRSSLRELSTLSY